MWAGLSRIRLGIGAVICALFVFAFVAPVSAQKSGRNESKYQDLIRRALQEYSAGNWTEARVFFEDAHAISPNARTLRGLGMTAYEARSYVESIKFLEQALASQVRALTPQLAKEARNVLEQARRFVSAVNVQLEPEEAELRVDGRVVSKDDQARLIVDPGEHEFTAAAEGYEPARRLMVAEGGRRINLHMVLKSDHPAPALPLEEQTPQAVAAPPVAATPAAAPQTAYQEQSVVPGLVLSLVGAGSLATGWVFYLLRQQIRTKTLDSQIMIGQISLYQTRGYLSLSLIGVGNALLAMSDYFWLPDDPGVPVWAWSVGALGLGVAVVGVVFAAAVDHCDVGDARLICQSSTRDPYFGPVFALHALPLLAIPFAYALRMWLRPSDVEVSVSWGGAHDFAPGLSLSGRF